MALPLSDITNQNGHIQRVERETRRPYGSSGDELREIINDLNEARDDVASGILMKSKFVAWDDTGHTDKQTGKFSLNANQNDYKITVDDNALDIYDIEFVRVLRASGDTQYHTLKQISSDDPRVPEFLNPNTAVTGQPSEYLKVGNVIYFDVLPESTIASGIEIGFKREKLAFTVTGTSGDSGATTGLPSLYDPLIHKKASLTWLLVNRSDDVSHISRLERWIENKEKDLGLFNRMRHPKRNKITMTRPLHI